MVTLSELRIIPCQHSMHRCCTGTLEVGGKLCQQAVKKFTKNDEEIFDSDERAAFSQSADRIPESVDDESSSAIRLSRRSSLLVKILSHFFFFFVLVKLFEKKEIKKTFETFNLILF